MRTTIASYRVLKAWVVAIGVLGVLLFMCWILLWVVQSGALQSRNRLFEIYCVVGFCISLPIALRSTFSLMRQIILGKGAAVWIENGLLHTPLFSVPCNEIVSSYLGEMKVSAFMKKPSVILQLRDGSEKYIALGLLVESRDVIIGRLYHALNLTPINLRSA